MHLVDYECQTTFWEDFSIAERFGEEAIKDTYKRVRAEWENDRIYGTELAMVLNHKCWYHYENGEFKLSRLYADLWEEYHYWVLDNWKGKKSEYYLGTTDLEYYLKTTD